MKKMDSIAPEIIGTLRQFNGQLMQIEEQIVSKAIILDKALQEECDTQKDGMCDYELDLDISFYNDVFDDPLLEHNEGLKNISYKSCFSFAHGDNHNDCATMIEHPLYGEFHCYLLHLLVTSYLEWNELKSISTIYWDIIPRYQYTQTLHICAKPEAIETKYLPIIYDKKTYDFYLPSFIEKEVKNTKYPLDLRKFDRIAGDLSWLYRLYNKPIKPISDKELERYHNCEYISRTRNDKETISTILNLKSVASAPLPMVNSYLIDPIRAITHGTIHAALLALKTGWAINIGGGFHHAHKNKGGGFSFFNDYALATIELRNINPSLKILYIDLDAHLGDGVLEFGTSTNNFYIFDVYNTFEPYLKTTKKSKDGRFTLVGIPPYTSDQRYLAVLERYLVPQVELVKPDFIFYNGGGDILLGDPLGKLSVTAEGLKQRDMMVFSEAKKRHIPIVMCLSGGYGPHNYKAVSDSLESIIELMQNSVMP